MDRHCPPKQSFVKEPLGCFDGLLPMLVTGGKPIFAFVKNNYGVLSSKSAMLLWYSATFTLQTMDLRKKHMHL
jgi:hypothetical protein